MKMTRTDNNHMPLQAGEVLEYGRQPLSFVAGLRLVLSAIIGIAGMASIIILIGALG